MTTSVIKGTKFSGASAGISGGGVTSYTQLTDKPQINGITLEGNKSSSTLGLAELDENGKVLSSQLPSYVDDVIDGYLYEDNFYEDSSHTELITPESSKIYIDVSTNKTYRWSGSAYVEISESLALGTTSSTAGRGDHTQAAYEHSLLTSGNPHNVTNDDVGIVVKQYAKFYIDAVNGSPDNDGLTSSTPVKSIWDLHTRYKYVHDATFYFMSNYSGAVNLGDVYQDSEFSVFAIGNSLTISSYPSSSPITITGYISVNHISNVTIQNINIDASGGYAPASTGIIRAEYVGYLYVSGVNITTDSNRCSGILTNYCNTALLMNNVSVSSTNNSNNKAGFEFYRTGSAQLYQARDTTPVISSGFKYVISTVMTQVLVSTMDIITNSSCTQGTSYANKINSVCGPVYVANAWQ